MPRKKRSSPPKIERKEELDDERNIPFKKRRVRLGKDGDFPQRSAVIVKKESPPLKEPSPSPLPQDFSPKPTRKEKITKPSSSKQQDDAEDYPPRKLNFEIVISKEDQMKAQDLWCEYWWNKLHPGEPLKLLKYVELERFDHPCLHCPPDDEEKEKKPRVEKRVRFA